MTGYLLNNDNSDRPRAIAWMTQFKTDRAKNLRGYRKALNKHKAKKMREERRARGEPVSDSEPNDSDSDSI